MPSSPSSSSVAVSCWSPSASAVDDDVARSVSRTSYGWSGAVAVSLLPSTSWNEAGTPTLTVTAGRLTSSGTSVKAGDPSVAGRVVVLAPDPANRPPCTV